MLWIVCAEGSEAKRKGGRELHGPLGVFHLFCRIRSEKMITDESMTNVVRKCFKPNTP